MHASASTTRSPEDVDMTVPVHAVATSAFDLPDHPARKADPALIAGESSTSRPPRQMPCPIRAHIEELARKISRSGVRARRLYVQPIASSVGSGVSPLQP
jgi:hypothetical protein